MNMPRSTYYYQAIKRQQDEQLLGKIEAIVLEFPRYGYRRVTKQLHRDGEAVNKKRIQRIMQKNDLQCMIRKGFKLYTTDSKHGFRIYPNLIKELAIGKLNQVWISDITYIKLLSGFVYLAVILDSYSRKVIGYELSRRINQQLTLEALRMAISNRQPEPGVIHHSDRGVQYAANAYIELLDQHEFKVSMSGKGNPYENAMAESFMKTLKYEAVYLTEYQSFIDVIKDVSGFIENVYNQKRLHSSLGYVPPNEFEQDHLNDAA
jgi:putative transposase